VAILEMTSPVIPLTWDPGPLPSARQNELLVNYSNTLPRLGEKLIKMPMSRPLLKIIKDLILFARMAHCVWSEADKVTAADEHWLFFRHQALLYRLLLLRDLDKREECIRLATLLFLLNALEYQGTSVPSRSTLRHLTVALISARFFEDGFDAGILFWCLCTGAMVKEPSGERDWFHGMLENFFADYIYTEKDFREDLECYLFLAEKQGTQISDLTDRLFATKQTSLG